MEKDKVNESSNTETILSMQNITKIYSNGYIANKNVNFDVKRGEIHGLVGENGAGKTTLMKVLFGLETPESGTVLINGNEIKIKNPLEALNNGIGMVHQHFMLIDSLTVAENMVLGIEPVKNLSFNYREAVSRTLEVASKFNLTIEPNKLVRDISVGFKQRVEILKMLLRGATILLLDEPTAVLTPQETNELFEQLKNLRDLGYSIVFISHKLNEVKELCDRITILRNGESIITSNTSGLSEKDISSLMIGRSIEERTTQKKSIKDDCVLNVMNLSYINKFNLYSFKNINFSLRKGEILGVAGVEGNGQSELANALAGLITPSNGSILLENKEMIGLNIRDIRENGIAIIHEDRMSYGASSTQSISENLISDRYYKKEMHKNSLLDWSRIVRKTKELIINFSIKADGPDAEVRTLSGGNIQKVVAAREFTSNPKLLIASQPTRGIDIGAAEIIRSKILQMKNEENVSTLLFSADLGELLEISDSIMVMYEGEIVAYFENLVDVNEEILGEFMLGIKKQSDEEMKVAKHEKD